MKTLNEFCLGLNIGCVIVDIIMFARTHEPVFLAIGATNIVGLACNALIVRLGAE